MSMTEAAKLDHRELLEQAASLLSDHPLIACGLRGIAAELDRPSSDPDAVRALEGAPSDGAIYAAVSRRDMPAEEWKDIADLEIKIREELLEDVAEAHLALDRLGAPRDIHDGELGLADRIVRLPSPAVPDGEWQPIETAPTDGTLVDLWSRVRLTDCRWESEPYAHGIPWGWTNSAFGRIMNATHWRPIPAGPALTEKRPPSSQEGGK